MPESPDFDQIALKIADAFGYSGYGHLTTLVSEELRQVWNARCAIAAVEGRIRGDEASQAVSQAYELGHTTGWNARGAADAIAVERRLTTLTGWITSEPYVRHMHAAIAELDR